MTYIRRRPDWHSYDADQCMPPADGLGCPCMNTQNRSGRSVKVLFQGDELQVPLHTTVAEVMGEDFLVGQGVLAAVLNHHVVSLSTPLDGDSVVEAVFPSSRDGQAVLRRTATHCFHAVFSTLFQDYHLQVGQSLLGGYYYEVLPGEGLDLVGMASRLQQSFDELVQRNLPLLRYLVSIEAVPNWVADRFGSRQKLLRAQATPMVPIVELDDYRDLMHGPCAPASGVLKGTSILAYPPGLVLRFPPVALTSPLPQPGREDRKLFQSYCETRDWNLLIGVSTVGDLNAASLEDRFERVVQLAEGLHEKKIAEIADSITTCPTQVRMVCIAGPSASGKSTFVNRLSVQLEVNGLRSVALSLDDFYQERQLPDAANLDLESLQALDLELLDSTLLGLLEGREMAVPVFDFASARRSRWRKLRLLPGQLLVIEGIHALHPDLAPTCRPEQRFRIFISALTQLRLDEHNRVFTSDARLIRRLVRDRCFRGFDAAETLARWPSVREGEENNIFPYQDCSDAMFNSALVYETAILQPLARRYLLEVPRTHPSRSRAYELLKFLDLFVPVSSAAIPANSVLREFIG